MQWIGVVLWANRLPSAKLDFKEKQNVQECLALIEMPRL